MLLFFDLCNTINVFFFVFGNETLNMRACLGGRLLVVFLLLYLFSYSYTNCFSFIFRKNFRYY